MRRFLVSLLVLALAVSLAPPSVAGSRRAARKRAEIDRMAEETLERLFAEKPGAKKLFERAYGYAVFDNLKLSLFISGGGGAGVAVNRKTGERTYMRMGTAGLNLGLGGQKYQVVFLFADEKTFRDFVDKGWQAGAEANAVAGKAGANAAASFRQGMAIYQLTEAGLMLQVDISGTKYWKWEKLNRRR